MHEDRKDRRPYQAPALRVFGGIAELTLDPKPPLGGTDCSPFSGSAGRADCS